MSTQRSSRPATPEHRGVLIAALLMALIGIGGIAQLVTTQPPFAFYRWLFFILLFFAVTGVALPFVRFLNMRFTPPGFPVPGGGVILRQSIWVALFVVMCAWLQIPRVLNLPIAFFLGLALVVIEVYLRLRERADEVDIG